VSVARIAHAELPARNRGPVDADGARDFVLGDPVLLTKESTTTFLVVKTTLSVMLTVFAVAVSTLWFRSSMTRLRVLALHG